jgi:hypothetical protein
MCSLNYSMYEKNCLGSKLIFLNFMALNEVIRENLLHTFEVLYPGIVTLTFRNFYQFFHRVYRAGGQT